ncbi:MAG: DUF4832 domain-containing protein [Defluviitaleaceae bacterium]|nr:DUF4832 domain-containing protein [Defluviitaleaceae bacterium]
MIIKPNWRRIPLWGLYDNRTPKNNPHKGWYLHYYDNGLHRYHDTKNLNDYLLDFPNFNHIYLRLAWSYLEPEEGKFRWDIVDEVIQRWWANDRRAAFRISTKETESNQPFATPEWVIKAGCRGEMVGFGDGPKDCFEPDYGDPVFLEKFNNFMAAFGERYDGCPFLEYIDVGSFGEWGEGHTEGTTERTWPVEVMKEHIDMHTRHFKKTPVLFNYDMAALRRTYDGTEEELLDYAVRKGMGVRADSCCVSFYEDRYGLSSMHMPSAFKPFYNVGPMDLEFCHYKGVMENEGWGHGFPGIASAYETHATYAGFHGYAREFLADHPDYAVKLGHLLGYWYFPQAAYLPGQVRAGQRVSMGISWENRGVSPCFTKYNLYMKLRNLATNETALLHLEECDNRRWEHCVTYDEIYSFKPPAKMPPGEYAVSVGLFEPNPENPKIPSGYTAPAAYPFPGRPIGIGLVESIRDGQGFYHLETMEIMQAADVPYEGVVIVPPLFPAHPKG